MLENVRTCWFSTAARQCGSWSTNSKVSVTGGPTDSSTPGSRAYRNAASGSSWLRQPRATLERCCSPTRRATDQSITTAQACPVSIGPKVSEASGGLAMRCRRSKADPRSVSLATGHLVSERSAGRRIVTPRITEAEQMQGFEAGWTSPSETVSKRKGTRWKLVGNAVTVGVSEWVGARLIEPGAFDAEVRKLADGEAWPRACCGAKGERWAVDASMWPVHRPYTHLRDIVDVSLANPLSSRAAAGFLDRAGRGSLRFQEGFLDDVASHVDSLAAA